MFFDWNKEKNEILKAERGVSFEEVVIAIKNGNLVANLKNNSENFVGQMVLVVTINNYTFYVPYVKQDEETFFLKTIIPSRKLHKIFNK